MEIKVFNTGIYSVNTLLVHIDEKNVFVVDPAGCIETQDEKIVSDYIKQNSLSLSGILLTHGHFDHITGTKILKQDFGKAQKHVQRSLVFAYANTQKKRLEMT